MNQLEAIRELTLVPPEKWREDPLRGSSGLVRWLPLLDLQGKGLFDGVSELGSWVSETKADIVVSDAQNCVLVLPAVEREYKLFRAEVEAALQGYGLSKALFSLFPVSSVVARSLDQCSDYWANFAFSWIDDAELEITPTLSKSLCTFKNSNQASQRCRHRAACYLK